MAATGAARIVHLAAVTVEELRRQTLSTLVQLAEGHSPNACWDDQRAMDLLRSQSTAEELLAIGASEELIDQIFSGGSRSE